MTSRQDIVDHKKNVPFLQLHHACEQTFGTTDKVVQAMQSARSARMFPQEVVLHLELAP